MSRQVELSRGTSLWAAALLLCLLMVPLPAAAQGAAVLGSSPESIAVVVGNKTYRSTVPVDFAGNDADAMRDYLVRSLGFREQNVVVLKDATRNELEDWFGPEAEPQAGKLWLRARTGRSDVFVYYSGHGVPDLKTRQPFLLPSDGNPDRASSGYPCETLYRNLELIKQKVGPERQVIVMLDACFTGETGRADGKGLLAVSAPGLVPTKPRTGAGVVKLVATSGSAPANWDSETKLGLFTSRFLMGAAGLALGSEAATQSSLAPCLGRSCRPTCCGRWARALSVTAGVSRCPRSIPPPSAYPCVRPCRQSVEPWTASATRPAGAAHKLRTPARLTSAISACVAKSAPTRMRRSRQPLAWSRTAWAQARKRLTSRPGRVSARKASTKTT